MARFLTKEESIEIEKFKEVTEGEGVGWECVVPMSERINFDRRYNKSPTVWESNDSKYGRLMINVERKEKRKKLSIDEFYGNAEID